MGDGAWHTDKPAYGTQGESAQCIWNPKCVASMWDEILGLRGLIRGGLAVGTSSHPLQPSLARGRGPTTLARTEWGKSWEERGLPNPTCGGSQWLSLGSEQILSLDQKQDHMGGPSTMVVSLVPGPGQYITC
jgi:hypothetical protein